MTRDDAGYDDADADFQRWYFGGSPPESDSWERPGPRETCASWCAHSSHEGRIPASEYRAPNDQRAPLVSA